MYIFPIAESHRFCKDLLENSIGCCGGRKIRVKIKLELPEDEVFEHQAQQGLFAMGLNAFGGAASGL